MALIFTRYMFAAYRFDKFLKWVWVVGANKNADWKPSSRKWG